MPPKKGQRQERGIARRQQILGAAFELFALNGYRTTSIADVAEQVGISDAGVLHHFPSKDALLLAVLAARDTMHPDAEAWVAEAGGGLGSLRRMPALAQALLDTPLLIHIDTVVMGESITEGGPAFDYFRRRLRLIRRALAAMLAEGVRRDEIRKDVDLDAKAAEMVAFMSGIQTQWLLDPDRINLVGAYQEYIDSLERELRTRHRPTRRRQLPRKRARA